MNPLSSASSEEEVPSLIEEPSASSTQNKPPGTNTGAQNKSNTNSPQTNGLNITSLPDTEDFSEDDELPQKDLTDESLGGGSDEESSGKEDSVSGKDCVRELSVVQACITSFKQFLHQFLMCKIFRPAFKDDKIVCESMIESYSFYLMKEYSSSDAFNVELKSRLKDFGSLRSSAILMESNVDHCTDGDKGGAAPFMKIEVGENWEDLLEAFDLSCKLLQSFCTLPVHKQNDAFLS